MRTGFAVGLVVICIGTVASGADVDDVIFDGRTLWRQHFTWKTPELRTEEGKLEPALLSIGNCACGKEGVRIETPPPPTGWAGADFDDSAWVRLPAWATRSWPAGWICGGGPNGRAPGYLGTLCLRAKFQVQDPEHAKALAFSIAYRGGVVVYLNGREVARSHLPAGDIALDAPAADYPLTAYEKGNPGAARKAEGIELPANLLRKGANVLAVELHRSPVLGEALKKHRDVLNGLSNGWLTAGIIEATLTAHAGVAAPNVARPDGIQVWNCNQAESVLDLDYGGPCEPLRPVRIVGVRNGVFSGKVAVGSSGPLKDIAAPVGTFERAGGGALPASAVQVRYPLPGEGDEFGFLRHPSGGKARRFDALVERPPEVLGAVQPVWVTVRVPRDAEPGEYAATLSIRSCGRAFDVPVALRVLAWTLPDPKDFFTHANFYQSPDSVAEQYNVPLWSDRHFDLIRKSFELVGDVGSKIVFVPLIAKTNQGHSQTMVRWIKRQDGAYDYDFGVMEKYLDAAGEGLGKPAVVCFNVWEVYGPGDAAFKGAKGKGMGPIVTVLDPATGAVSETEGPKYDSAESPGFWKPVLTGVRERMEKRGWADVMMLGQSSDIEIDPRAAGVFKAILPDLKWVRTSHACHFRRGGDGKDDVPSTNGPIPILYQENAYGTSGSIACVVPHDPDCRRVSASKGPMWAIFTRANTMQMHDTSSLAMHRVVPDLILSIGRRGFSRVGADFWPYLAKGRDWGSGGILPCRYPMSSVSQLNMRYAAILAAGPDGPLPTARLETVREGVQECEARVFVERALDTAREKLGADLAGRAQTLLDERVRLARFFHMNSQGFRLSYPGSGWQDRSQKLYETAAEVAATLGATP